jgi:hypothetical protein
LSSVSVTNRSRRLCDRAIGVLAMAATIFQSCSSEQALEEMA